ncbi:hypothetical protein P7H62_07055 [Vagococcus carniphilus]|uniref:hypothetical protein n=1 Tax=Vagococcus carniphilus TaxID=218144 RepID=UPI00288C7945|nr:hypothetical protein [Vagococcus carniphilus]MDT2831106.1 hypothetical protein [Vagococcus carniphilus]MDT2839735.1 hypothetical protein [Vagococcus carniphilus]MDT2854204.1 hypothetical protein [Vagococcus carniphilus]
MKKKLMISVSLLMFFVFGFSQLDVSAAKNQPQGKYISDGSYVQVNKKNYGMWQNFNWKKKNNTTNVYQKTFQARGRYKHQNGSTYYSLYDSKGKWYGYLNANATKKTGKQGAYISDGSHVKINRKNYGMWQNFSWKKKGNTTEVYDKTFQARGRYEHFNGSTYYSLYDNKGKWYGYLNVDATTKVNAQGTYISDGSYVKVSKMNYDMWQNFGWKSKNKTNNFYYKIFQAKGRYEHFNGSTYYSLYDSKGKWYGYLNAVATQKTKPEGNFIDDGRHVEIKKPNYELWENFNWKKKDVTTAYIGKTFVIRGRYEHFNGSTYYSLYDYKGKWYGYLNAKATEMTLRPHEIKNVYIDVDESGKKLDSTTGYVEIKEKEQKVTKTETRPNFSMVTTNTITKVWKKVKEPTSEPKYEVINQDENDKILTSTEGYTLIESYKKTEVKTSALGDKLTIIQTINVWRKVDSPMIMSILSKNNNTVKAAEKAISNDVAISNEHAQKITNKAISNAVINVFLEKVNVERKQQGKQPLSATEDKLAVEYSHIRAVTVMYNGFEHSAPSKLPEDGKSGSPEYKEGDIQFVGLENISLSTLFKSDIKTDSQLVNQIASAMYRQYIDNERNAALGRPLSPQDSNVAGHYESLILGSDDKTMSVGVYVIDNGSVYTVTTCALVGTDETYEEW